MRNPLITTAVLLAVGLLAGRADAQALPQSETGVTETTEPTLVVSKPGARIGFDEVDARMLQIPRDKRAGFINDPERIEQLLQSMMLIRQLAGVAREQKLESDPLVALEVTLAVEQVLAKRALASFEATVVPPDFRLLAEERYNADPSVFDTPPVVDVRHLLVKRELHGDAAARELAGKLRAEFLAGKASFEEFVKQHSEEPRAAEHGGLVNGLTRGKADGAFEQAAFGLSEPGAVSEVVASPFGYHLIQLVGRVDAKRRPFAEVKPIILAELEAKYRADQRDKFLEGFKAAPMTANPDNVLALRTRYLPDGEGAKRLQALEGTATVAPTAAAGAAIPTDE